MGKETTKTVAMGDEPNEPKKRELTPDELARQFAKMTSHKNGSRPAKQLFVDEQWLATRLGVDEKTIQKWRYYDLGPAWHKLGANGAVRYRLRDIYAFEKKCRRSPMEGHADPAK